MIDATKLFARAGWVCLLGAVTAGCGPKSPGAGAAPPPGAPAAAAPASGPAAATESIEVFIKADGSVDLGSDLNVPVDTIAAKVKARYADPSRIEARILADAHVTHGKVVAVMDQIRQAGVTRLAIVLDSAKPAAPTPAPASGSAPDRQTQPDTQAAAAAASSSAPPPAPALPEVKVENIGLHIGGGPNDDASKQPFKQAIEPHFDDFRKCYALVDEPAKGGTFGVDLRVGRNGGKPEVHQPRTGIKGKKFRDCMVEAFKTVEFGKPHKPVVFSYSLRFTVGG